MKKKIINFALLIGITAFTLQLLVRAYSTEDIIMLKHNTEIKFILLGVMALIINWFLEAVIMNVFGNAVELKIGFLGSLKYTLIGKYYNLITPFYSGGQPVQAYCMANDGHSISKTTTVLVNKFMIFQIVLNIYSLSMIIYNFNLIMSTMKTAIPFVIIGLVLNIGMITLIAVLFFNKKVFEKMIYWGIGIAYKIKVIKDIKHVKNKAISYFEDYYTSLKNMWKNKILFVKTAILTALMMTSYYFITYCVYLALSLRDASAFNIMSMQAILNMAVVFIPTPGTVGASEGGFYLLYKYYFGGQLVAFAILVWRLIVYYLNIAVCGCVALLDYIVRKRRKKVIIGN